MIKDVIGHWDHEESQRKWCLRSDRYCYASVPARLVISVCLVIWVIDDISGLTSILQHGLMAYQNSCQKIKIILFIWRLRNIKKIKIILLTKRKGVGTFSFAFQVSYYHSNEEMKLLFKKQKIVLHINICNSNSQMGYLKGLEVSLPILGHWFKTRIQVYYTYLSGPEVLRILELPGYSTQLCGSKNQKTGDICYVCVLIIVLSPSSTNWYLILSANKK